MVEGASMRRETVLMLWPEYAFTLATRKRLADSDKLHRVVCRIVRYRWEAVIRRTFSLHPKVGGSGRFPSRLLEHLDRRFVHTQDVVGA